MYACLSFSTAAATGIQRCRPRTRTLPRRRRQLGCRATPDRGVQARDQELPHNLLASRCSQSNADGKLVTLDQGSIGNTCPSQSCKRFGQQGNATPTCHIRKQYVMVSRLLDLPRRKAVVGENTLAVVVERRLTRTLEPEDDLRGEVGELNCSAPGQAVGRWHRHHHRHPVKLHHVKTRGLCRQRDESCRQSAGTQLAHESGGCVDDHRHGRVGMTRLEPFREPAEPRRFDGARETKPQTVRHALMGQTGLGLAKQSSNTSRIGQQLAAGVGEAHTLSTAVEQAGAQPLLEFTNRTAQRWLG